MSIYVEKIFVLLMLIAGIILILTSYTIYNKLKPDCSPNLKTKARIGIGVGSLTVSLAIGYFMCHLRCDCGEHTRGANAIMAMSFLLGGFMIGLTGFIDKDVEKCKLEGAQNFIKASYYSSGCLVTIGFLFFASKLFLKGGEDKEDGDDSERKGMWGKIFGKKETADVKRNKELLKTERESQALAKEQALSERETQAQLGLKLQQYNTVIAQDNKQRASQGLEPRPLMTLNDILRTSGTKEQVLAKMAETREKTLASLSPEKRAQAEREDESNKAKRESYLRGVSEKQAASRITSKPPDAAAIALAKAASEEALASIAKAASEKATEDAFEAQKKQNDRNLSLARQTAEISRSTNIETPVVDKEKARQQFLGITAAEEAAKLASKKSESQGLTGEQIVAQAEAKAKEGKSSKAFFEKNFTNI